MKKNTTVKPLSTIQLVLIPLVIAVFTFICFSPALKNGFTNWDDNGYVFENASLKKPLSQTIPYYFGPHYFIGNYIPVTMIVYALEYHANGLNAHTFHVVNLLIHLANVLLIFWFVYLLSNKKPLVAAFVALFFGIHPMHVESVAWVAELKDVLYTLFFLAGLITYCKYKEKNYKHYPMLILTFLFFLLSTLAKPAAVIFPIILFVIDFYQERKFNVRAWVEKLPFFAISIIFGCIAIKAQQADHLVHNDYDLLQKICFASYSLLSYFIKCFVPSGQSIFYPYPVTAQGQLPFICYASPVLVAALVYLVFRALKQSRLFVFGFLFFFVNVVLVLQLISVGDAVMAERYTYVSYTGIFFVVALKAEELYYHTKSISRMLVQGIVIFAVAVFAFLTHSRCKVWQNDLTIATDLLNKYPNDRLALNNKGFILLEQRRYDEAIPLFVHAIELKPDYKMAYINLADAYLALNNYDAALKTTEQALSHLSQDRDLLNKKGLILMRRGNFAEAVEVYKQSIQVKKENGTAYSNLAECYFNLKEYDQSMKTVNTALSYDPDNYILLNNKGYILLVTKKYSEALGYFEASLKINPDYTTATANLANCRRALNAAAKVPTDKGIKAQEQVLSEKFSQ